MDKDNKEALEPEVLAPQGSRELEKREDRPLGRGVLSKPQSLAGLNRFQAKKVESYRKVIEEETRLFGALNKHGRVLEELRDIDIDIEKEKSQRRRALEEEKAKAARQAEEIRIAEEELKEKRLAIQVRQAEHRRRLKELEEGPKEPLTKAEQEEKKLKEDEEVRKVRGEAKVRQAEEGYGEGFEIYRARKKGYAKAREKILKGREPSELSEEEREELNDLERYKFYQEDDSD